jgi:hypothetical protein
MSTKDEEDDWTPSIVDLREAELVEIQVGLGGKVWVNVDGVCRFRAYSVKKINVECPHSVITIEQQKPRPVKQTRKEKKDEEWEMDQLMPSGQPGPVQSMNEDLEDMKETEPEPVRAEIPVCKQCGKRQIWCQECQTQ